MPVNIVLSPYLLNFLKYWSVNKWRVGFCVYACLLVSVTCLLTSQQFGEILEVFTYGMHNNLFNGLFENFI